MALKPGENSSPVQEQRNNYQSSLLRGLGIVGLRELEPVILAALVTEDPLLLVGAHGTGKSLLLTRISEALGLQFRHYNSSLLNFDDLVGFPLPTEGGSLEYIKTPAAIWGAEAVIFDEISRCRPDMQNKLFPIVHERRVQGILLEELRYRWAAMNPPVSDEDDGEYIGSEPLDPALADRFAFVVKMPGWEHFNEEEQIAVIRGDSGTVGKEAADRLRHGVGSARAVLPAVAQTIGEPISVYIRTLVALLAQAGFPLSPRRASMLHRSILAVHAVSESLALDMKPAEATLLALLNTLPQRAQGTDIPELKLLSAHREAWRLSGVEKSNPIRAILTTADPVDRIRLAVMSKGLAKGDFSTIVADVISQIKPGAREAVVVHLFESNAVGRLNAAIAEQVAEIYADIAAPINLSESVHASTPRFATWNRIKDILSRLDSKNERSHLAANALASCFARKYLNDPDEADNAFSAWIQTDGRLTGITA
jgi:MoxR-like ATPase